MPPNNPWVPPPPMPTEPWLFACGFRTVIGKLIELSLPQKLSDDITKEKDEEKIALIEKVIGKPSADAEGEIVNGQLFVNGKCTVAICHKVYVTVTVDLHTAIIGLSPSRMNEDNQAFYHVGELVQVNLMARHNHALSIERYFTDVAHMSNARS